MGRPAVRPAMTRGAWSSVVLVLILTLAAPGPLALERLQRRFGLQEGLPFSEVAFLSQDTRGFIWIATSGGLFRYDGIEMRPWPRTAPGSSTKYLSAGPDGEVLMTDYTFTLQEVAGDGLRPVPGPDGSPPVLEWPPVWDAQGCLWIVSGGRLWFRPRGGAWTGFSSSRIGSERPTGIEPDPDGTLIVITSGGIWRLDAKHDSVHLAAILGASKALRRTDGSLAVLMNRGDVLEIHEGAARAMYAGLGRPLDMVQRGSTLWVSYDNGLVALRPGEPPEALGPEQDVPSGGPLLVDREGSLWLGTYRGLRQFPAPESVALGPSSARRLARSTEGIWVDSWGGLELIRSDGERYHPEVIPGSTTSALCVGTDGTLWTGYRGRFLERRNGRFIEHPHPDLNSVYGCATGPDGRVWMTTGTRLVVARRDAGESSIRDVAGPPLLDEHTAMRAVLEDSEHRLWITGDDRVCHTDAIAEATGGTPPWRCTRIESAGIISDLGQNASGSLWAGTVLAGIYGMDPDQDTWVPLPGSRRLPTNVVRRLRPSPSGGEWIVSYGTILRVVERPGSEDDWEVVEHPSTWHGLMISDAEDILEEPTGDLWIATLAGVVHVPAEVRRSAAPVPAVELVDVLQDSSHLPLRDGLELPWRRNRIELRFAALSYRDPGLLRYQMRLHPDAAWTDSSGPPSFRFVDLPPGSYHAEVRASLDGTLWSGAPAGLSFTVLPPFWRTWWFLSLVSLAIVAAVYALYRYRLAHLLKLERMRTRIAADLHDDIGSSLSRIAIQSDLIRGPAALRPEDSERLLSEIGTSARTLVDSMSDIVWSIDPKRDDLASVVARVRQFALDMLEPLGVCLALSVPDGAERVRLAPEQRRHLYLFFKEAIHNIGKHSGCRNAAIALRVEGSRLTVEVRDDGLGFDAATAPAPATSGARGARGGHGLDSMRARAGQLGGTLVVDSTPGSGTTLRLTCPIDHAGA